MSESGSMATSVVYFSIFAAVMAPSPPSRRDSSYSTHPVVHLTEMLIDPVNVLFGVQLGGGTDINRALAYCECLVRQPGVGGLLFELRQ
jgi:hypothetical protein